jgi:hypothetical protein
MIPTTTRPPKLPLFTTPTLEDHHTNHFLATLFLLAIPNFWTLCTCEGSSLFDLSEAIKSFVDSKENAR